MTSTEIRKPDNADEVTRLAQRVATARGKLPLQADPALFAELSEQELQAERDLAEWERAQQRKQRRLKTQYEIKQQRLARRTNDRIRAEQETDARWHRRAIASRRRVADPDSRLAQLFRRAEWSSRALIGVVVLGMLWAGVNVQHNLVPSGDMTDPLYWLSYGFEAMVSIPIITIMVVATTAARWGRALARGRIIFAEMALLGVTVALNAGPHLAHHAPARAAEAAMAPVMVGVVIWLHAWVSERYAYLIDSIPGAAPTTTAVAAAGAEPTIAVSEAPEQTVDPIDNDHTTRQDDSDVVRTEEPTDPAPTLADQNAPTEASETAPEDTAGGGVVAFARRTPVVSNDTSEDNAKPRPLGPRSRRWFGGNLSQDEIERLAQIVFDSGRTQQTLDSLTKMIGYAVAGETPTAIARELGMTAHSTVQRILNTAEELRIENNKVA